MALEANCDSFKGALEVARSLMESDPFSGRVLQLLQKAERMAGPSGAEVRKTMADWKVIESVLAHRGDPFAILGLTPFCTESDIKAVRKRLSLKLHPDKNSLPHSVEAFKAVQEACAIVEARLALGEVPEDAGVTVTCGMCTGAIFVQIIRDAMVPPPADSVPGSVGYIPFRAQCCHCHQLVSIDGGVWSPGPAQPAAWHVPEPGQRPVEPAGSGGVQQPARKRKANGPARSAGGAKASRAAAAPVDGGAKAGGGTASAPNLDPKCEEAGLEMKRLMRELLDAAQRAAERQRNGIPPDQAVKAPPPAPHEPTSPPHEPPRAPAPAQVNLVPVPLPGGDVREHRRQARRAKRDASLGLSRERGEDEQVPVSTIDLLNAAA